MHWTIWILRLSRSSILLLRVRSLATNDLFKAVRTIKASGLREDIKPLLQRASEGNADVQSIGIDAIMTVIGVMAEKNVEEDLYDFLSGPFEMEPGVIAQMNILDLCDHIQWLWEEGNLKTFFGRLSNLIGTKS